MIPFSLILQYLPYWAFVISTEVRETRRHPDPVVMYCRVFCFLVSKLSDVVVYSARYQLSSLSTMLWCELSCAKYSKIYFKQKMKDKHVLFFSFT